MSEMPSGGGWNEIERELRRAARIDAVSVDRIMARVRATPRAKRRAIIEWLTRRRVLVLSPAHVFVTALVTVLVAAGGRVMVVRRSAVPAATAPTLSSTRGVQFMFVGKAAQRVSVAGDFNNWDPSATPMKRVANNDVWSVVVPLAPGRYVYSFVVDGRRWVPDASAPRAPTGEYGQATSVAYVKLEDSGL